ncbi:MAG: aquaporin [Dehalococcoidia bacterium]|jgi:aquaporin TIP|nr:aquaporin [Dehalococcoidia bacterium]MDP6226746.1 aquaporin [Dehalococcoidia bacterium]MDP7082979.1 aquaporin [Dehalococcoidia bacterium]MDP7510329.1 aquaporin [Dehalococcoidia bacterium]
MDKILGIGDLTSVDTWRGVVAETIGVLVFVLVGTGAIIATGALDVLSGNVAADATVLTGSARLVAIALALGFTYMALVALTVGISGGHINPAVTFGAVVTGRMGVAKGVVYVIGQVAGAIVASYILKVVLTDVAIGIEGNLGGVAWNPIAVDNLGSALVIELILGFVLVFVMLAAVIGPGEGASPVAPIAVGLIVVVGTLLAWGLTGAAMNPARALGPALAAEMWTDHWIYWVGPLGGAAIAGIIYDGVFTGRLWGKR